MIAQKSSFILVIVFFPFDANILLIGENSYKKSVLRKIDKKIIYIFAKQKPQSKLKFIKAMLIAMIQKTS